MSGFVRFNSIRFPTAIALENADTGETTSWSELEQHVGRLAGQLSHGWGVAKGDRVAYLAADTPLTFEVLLACMRIGAIFVPLNRRLSAAELEVLARDAGPRLLLHDEAWRAAATPLAAAAGAPLADVDALAAAASERSRPAGWEPLESMDPADPVMLLYTSGTTGLPKGAIITEGMMLAQTVNILDSMGIAGPPVKYLSALPLFHAAGLLAIAMPVLLSGGTIVQAGRFAPDQVARLLGDAAYGVTNFNGAPVMYRAVADAAGPDSDFSHVRHGMVGGGDLAEDLYEYFRARGLELQVGWGATEMGPSSTIMPQGRAGAPATRGVGQLVPLTRLRVVSPDGGDVGPGEVGEAWVSGPSISPGYWRQTPEQDQAHVDGWFRSGDAVSVAPDGHVAFHGRFKDMYKSGGENVFAAEVERVLLGCPGVLEAAVIGVPHHRWGEAGRAVIVASPGAGLAPEHVIAHCRTRLAGYKVPADIVFAGQLPRNVTGKVAKIDLLRSYGSPIEAGA
jgi:fatty-acyl-CoA synthase